MRNRARLAASYAFSLIEALEAGYVLEPVELARLAEAVERLKEWNSACQKDAVQGSRQVGLPRFGAPAPPR